MTLPARDWPAAAWTIARTFGVRGAMRRAEHELRRRANRFLSAPRHIVGDVGEPLRWLAVPPETLGRATVVEVAAARAARVVGGEHQAYRATWRPIPRTREEWYRHPGAAESYPHDVAWWRIALLDPKRGDVKDVWEPARFGWAYDLVRAFVVSRDERAAERFYEVLEEWMSASPPFSGVHWACGQETAIRAVALLYAEANLAGSAASTPERRVALTRVLVWSGERIADAIGYALSQRNNHAISEALGLALLGARLAQVHPDAAEWLERGCTLLDRLVLEQFAEDGWYAQHSLTYARLALDQLVLAQRLFTNLGRAFSPEARQRIAAAHALILSVVDSRGDVPNHGANDGAFVAPITLAPYRDFRPLLTTVATAFGLPLPADVAEDREAAAWTGGGSPADAPARAAGVQHGASGWAAAAATGVRLFFRAGRYRSRPGHIDALHLDVRVGGRPVVVDAGSFAYNAAGAWRRGLGGARVHNGPIVDGREPGVRGPRFLWLRWPDAELVSAVAEGETVRLAGQREDVRRDVLLRDGIVTVLDRPRGAGERSVEVHWLLAEGLSPDLLESDADREVIPAREDSIDGWISWQYGARTPGTLVILRGRASASAPLQTRIRTDRVLSSPIVP